MAFKKKKSFKPLNFSGVIENVEKVTDENGEPFKGQFTSDIRLMSNYYKYKVTISGEDTKTFIHNLPVGQDFPFPEGQRVSFKAFPQKAEGEYKIVHKSLAKQLSEEEIQAYNEANKMSEEDKNSIKKQMKSKEKTPSQSKRPTM